MHRCRCGHRTNVAYVFKGKSGGAGKWVAVGQFCTWCGKFYNLKKVRCVEGVKVGAK